MPKVCTQSDAASQLTTNINHCRRAYTVTHSLLWYWDGLCQFYRDALIIQRGGVSKRGCSVMWL